MDNFEQQNSQNKADEVVSSLSKSFTVIGKGRSHSWHAYAFWGVTFGAIIAVAFVANQRLQFDASQAAKGGRSPVRQNVSPAGQNAPVGQNPFARNDDEPYGQPTPYSMTLTGGTNTCACEIKATVGAQCSDGNKNSEKLCKIIDTGPKPGAGSSGSSKSSESSDSSEAPPKPGAALPAPSSSGLDSCKKQQDRVDLDNENIEVQHMSDTSESFAVVYDHVTDVVCDSSATTEEAKAAAAGVCVQACKAYVDDINDEKPKNGSEEQRAEAAAAVNAQSTKKGGSGDVCKDIGLAGSLSVEIANASVYDSFCK